MAFSYWVLIAASGLAAAGPAIQNVGTAQWAALNNTVGGRLARGYPMAKSCYSVYNGSASPPDLADCAAVQAGYQDDIFITSHFGGLPTVNWGTCQAKAQHCNLDFTLPSNPIGYYAPPNNCYQGSVSPYYINVQGPKDVQAAFAFARKTKVPISVKNSGHDYKGRSSAPNSLSLWMQNLRPAIKLNKAFKAAGCSTSYQAVTFGGGQDFVGLYDFAEANNITIVGGSSRTVRPAGGWITGAGHSALSPTFGLGVDNVLELKVVLPTGEFVTASRCQNKDIFFALRGGGGGTFGVVTEMTTRAHPRVQLQVVFFSFTSIDPTGIDKFMKVLVEQASKWADERWGGYIEPGIATKLESGLVLMTPKLTYDEAVASMKPLADLALQLGNSILPPIITTVQSYGEAFNKFLLPFDEQVDIGVAIGSRLIPRANFATESARAQLLNAMSNVRKQVVITPGLDDPRKLGYGAPLQILVTTPVGYQGSGNDSAVTPAWRQAIWHIIVGVTMNNNAPVSEISQAFRIAHSASEVLRQITPGSGAYQNEADVFEPNPVAAFWGQDNYAKLQQIKRKVDPNNLLTCWQCIGWEGSKAERYQCYPGIGT